MGKLGATTQGVEQGDYESLGLDREVDSDVGIEIAWNESEKEFFF
jgi:hypothetical protein